MSLPLKFQLEQYEGPLDLLLDLIRKQQINIYDIPIALITKQYLDHITAMKMLNLDVAGEFLVMAATLIYIKSRMLLPAEPSEDEEEGEDPRADLVRRLLEYKQFKEAAHALEGRGRQCANTKEEDGPLDLTLLDLMDALQDVIQRTPAKALMELSADHFTVKDRMNYILERLEEEEAIPFEMLFRPEEGRLVLIVTFLGLLELIRLRLVRAFQPEAFAGILLSRAFLPADIGDAELEETQE